MSFLAISCAAACLVCFLALAWLTLARLPQETSEPRGARIEDLLAQHALHFPQLRQSLAGPDRRYVRHLASAQAQNHWRDERRQVVATFMSALGEDFARMQQLAALAKGMLPKELARQTALPLSLQLQFRANYRIASLLLGMGGLGSRRRITRLVELLANLSVHTEASITTLAHIPAPGPVAPPSRTPPD